MDTPQTHPTHPVKAVIDHAEGGGFFANLIAANGEVIFSSEVHENRGDIYVMLANGLAGVAIEDVTGLPPVGADGRPLEDDAGE